jgi:hypothetical protein
MVKSSTIRAAKDPTWNPDLRTLPLRRDPLLERIDALLRFHRLARRDWRMLPVLSLLFLAMDTWLQGKSDPGASCDQSGCVYEAYPSLAVKLCALFDCTLEEVPQEIERIFGPQLVAEGRNNDSNDALSAAISEDATWRFRLWFREGRIYQFPHWISGLMKALIPAESRRREAPRERGSQTDYARYTLCGEGEVYQFPAEENDIQSSVGPCGITVQMLVRCGRVLRIREIQEGATSNSLAMIQALQRNGMPTNSIVIEDYQGRKLSASHLLSGHVNYLDTNGGARWGRVMTPQSSRRQASCSENRSWGLWQPPPIRSEQRSSNDATT